MKRIRLGTVTIDQTDIDAVVDVMKKGFIGPGELTKKFEETIAAAHGYKYGLALNSGQSAIMVVLEAMKDLYGIKRVACPAITYISSLHAIVQAGLQPVLFDVELNSEAAMLPDNLQLPVDAYLPCHLFGRANKPIEKSSYKLIVEDACESIYAPGVGYGNAVCLSFFSSHTITAGYGGMILLNDKDLYFRCWQLVCHGRKDWDNYSTCHNLKERFIFSDVGYSLKFCDLNAALGLAQHNKRDWIISERRKNAQYLIDNLKKYDNLILPTHDGHTFMLFPVIVKDDTRDKLLFELNNNEIETRMMMPVINQPVVKEKLFYPSIESNYPNAKFINEHGFHMGCHQDMTQEDLDKIIGVFKKIYG
jgi:dTDP-4-amino-4,6-dideoxygalactose transaminase